MKQIAAMAEVSYLAKQTKDVYDWTSRFLKTIPFDKDLAAALEPADFPHPVAGTKREAIEWNIHHIMCRCGQVGILNRVVNKRFDFGLSK